MKNYYKENCDQFIKETFNNDMSKMYNFFEKHLKTNSTKILDIGFGSGRDSLYFQNKGYHVYSLDPIEEFCIHGEKIGLKKIFNQTVQEMKFNNEFDGIWACASLLHIPSYELVSVLENCYNALKEDSVMYCSFKYGDFEGELNGRRFLNLMEERFRIYVSKTKFKIIEMCVTDDVRPDRTDKWLNVILKK